VSAKKILQDKNGWSTDRGRLEKIEADHPLCAVAGAPHLEASQKAPMWMRCQPWWSQKTGRFTPTLNQAVTATGRLVQQHPTCRTSPSYAVQARRNPARAFLPQEAGSLISPITPRSSCASSPTSQCEEVAAVRPTPTATSKNVALPSPPRLLLDKTEGDAEERRLAKQFNFGVIYPAWAPSAFARETGVSQLQQGVSLRKTRALPQGFRLFWSCRSGLASRSRLLWNNLRARRPFAFDPGGLAG